MITKLCLFLITLGLTGCQVASQKTANHNQLNSTKEAQQSETSQSRLPETISKLPTEYQRLTIPYLRTQNFPGSQLASVSKLPDQANYSQEVVSYKSEDLTIQGLLTKPTSPVPASGYPAIVFIHGYIPPESYRTTEKYQAYVDYLARNGFVVFKIDLRGHGVSQGLPTGAYYSSDYIYDILNAYASLAKLDYVDDSKIGLWGHSMAGNLVLRTMAVKPDIPMGVIWAGAVYTYQDMQTFRISDSSYQPSQNPNRGKRDELFATVGRVDDAENQFWPYVIPTNYLADIQGQIYLHHATNDQVVNIGYSRNLDQILSKSQIIHQLYEYPSGGHNLESPAFSQAMAKTVENFKSM